ncbi:secreted/surface protein with fasciclin-like repeats [Pyrinomonas methylaliphatogenes]|jgi:uncharacterized surface protein with fasciclin (FAS1) repeats|uniref:Secreted/surface protein with fasciclin-like repeats n=2 Tax=Pyrinomonas methylaliphatogenes TaxID=454194 RepID=A0A0B6WYU1_9BACT|nr:fasciclin domain-containing protein [Pyrinomonas methylaliphatogenes]CDM65320.1 secreted/surface protein with fasciclin-like repeats [Pyrinomonas methylaliphatogenes]
MNFKRAIYRFCFAATLMCAALAVSTLAQTMQSDMSAQNNMSMQGQKDIVDTLMSDPQFSTLVMLVQKANLVDTLKGPGPFTVFAPTNDAFAKIPKQKLDALMNDPEKLRTVLLYHVINMNVPASAARTMPAPTAAGAQLSVKVSMRGNTKMVMVDNAKVIRADIMASNGVIHAIDTVLMPKMNKMNSRR